MKPVEKQGADGAKALHRMPESGGALGQGGSRNTRELTLVAQLADACVYLYIYIYIYVKKETSTEVLAAEGKR